MERTGTTVSFSGHESFPLRYPWLKKGYELLLRNSRAFGDADAMVDLGVGKNMVGSIRHWGLAAGVWEEVSQSRGREIQSTRLGECLLADDGWDPFLEVTGTIWWLFWRVVTEPHRATSWQHLFGENHAGRFSRTELVAGLEELRDEAKMKRAPRSTIQRDVDVLIRSCCVRRSKAGVIPEDSIDCPFAQLGVLRPGPDRGVYELVRAGHPSLPVGVLLSAIVDYCLEIRARRPGLNPTLLVSLDELLYGSDAPGRVFCLSESALESMLTEIVRSNKGTVELVETAGLRQLRFAESLEDDLVTLGKFYRASASMGVTR
jgi:hypothetical protein